MSDMGLEAPDADAAEQQQDAVPEDENEADADVAEPQPPLEANEADAAEQKRELNAPDDEYR
jgi:hypothetical protein